MSSYPKKGQAPCFVCGKPIASLCENNCVAPQSTRMAPTSQMSQPHLQAPLLPPPSPPPPPPPPPPSPQTPQSPRATSGHLTVDTETVNGTFRGSGVPEPQNKQAQTLTSPPSVMPEEPQITGRQQDSGSKRSLTQVLHCHECTRSFRDKFYLDRHVLFVHRQRGSHVCRMCGFAFQRMQDLRQHMKVHRRFPSDERPQSRVRSDSQGSRSLPGSSVVHKK